MTTMYSKGAMVFSRCDMSQRLYCVLWWRISTLDVSGSQCSDSGSDEWRTHRENCISGARSICGKVLKSSVLN